MLVRYYAYENRYNAFQPYDEDAQQERGLVLSYANVIASRRDVDDSHILEVIFEILNRDNRPNRSKFRSLSVGDVVTLSHKGDAHTARRITSYAVEPIGFKALSGVIQAEADEVLDLLLELESIKPHDLLWKEESG